MSNSRGFHHEFLLCCAQLTNKKYGFRKRVEHFWRGLSNPKDQVSAIPPEGYGERFFNFISSIVKSPEEAARDKEARSHGDSTDTAAAVPANSQFKSEHMSGSVPPPLTSGDRGSVLPVVEEAREGTSSHGSTRSEVDGALSRPTYMDGAPMVKNDSGLGQHSPSPHESFDRKISVHTEDMAIRVTRVVRS